MTCAHDVHAPVLARVYEPREVKPKISVAFQKYAHVVWQIFGILCSQAVRSFLRSAKLTLCLPSKNSILHPSTVTRSSGSLRRQATNLGLSIFFFYLFHVKTYFCRGNWILIMLLSPLVQRLDKRAKTRLMCEYQLVLTIRGHGRSSLLRGAKLTIFLSSTNSISYVTSTYSWVSRDVTSFA